MSKRKSYQKKVENKLNKLTVEEMLKYIPKEFLFAAVEGFLAGEVGPKKHIPHSWLDMDLNSLGSFLGHIAQTEKGTQDPDTDLDPEIFVAARAVMYVTQKCRERVYKNAYDELKYKSVEEVWDKEWEELLEDVETKDEILLEEGYPGISVIDCDTGKELKGFRGKPLC